eukprot:403377229
MPHEEDQQDDSENQYDNPNIAEDAQSESDDEVNENLFSSYDDMFLLYNQFGQRFQETAHYIGLLIKKNMMLNQKLEDYTEKLDDMQIKLKQSEEAYENVLSEMNEKDRLVEDLLNEVESYKFQIEQMPLAQGSNSNNANNQRRSNVNQGGSGVQTQLQFGQQRDILKERMDAAAKAKKEQDQQNFSAKKKIEVQPLAQKQTDLTMNHLQINNKRNSQVPQALQTSNKKSNQNQNQDFKLKRIIADKDQPLRIGGTYESFFEVGDKLNANCNSIDDSSSLRDLFSQRNTKKRQESEISQSPETLKRMKQRQNKQESKEEEVDEWITVNKQKKRKSYEEDSQMIEKFQKLSQAFFNPKGPPQNTQINNSSTFTQNQFNRNKVLYERDSIESSVVQNNEDSASSQSFIHSGIRFDAQQAQESLKQIQKSYNQKQQMKPQKKYELELVEQVTDSFVDDFFTVKHEKKPNVGRGNNSNQNNKDLGKPDNQKNKSNSNNNKQRK